jgi:hypothetical protein
MRIMKARARTLLLLAPVFILLLMRVGTEIPGAYRG